MRRYAALLFFVGACGGEGDDGTIDITHDLCAPLALVTSSPTEVQAEGIAGALALWRDHGAPSVGEPGGASIELRFEPAALAFRGLYDDERGVIYINSDLTDPAWLSIVIAHELGHAFGLAHVTDRDSLMNPGNMVKPPTADDEAAVEAMWGVCEPATSASVPPATSRPR